jgi:hypothetical protein
MISFTTFLILVALAVSTETILEIGSELTAASLDDPMLGAKVESIRLPQTALVDLSPTASLHWQD